MSQHKRWMPLGTKPQYLLDIQGPAYSVQLKNKQGNGRNGESNKPCPKWHS